MEDGVFSRLPFSSRNFFKYSLNLSALATYLFLYAPIMVVVYLSFDARTGNLSVTLEWYQNLLSAGDLISSLIFSLQIAIGTMTISTALGTILAFGLLRSDWLPGKDLLTGYLTMPMMLPVVSYAVALFVFVSTFGLGTGALAILVGHVVYTLPFAMLVMLSGVREVDKELEEAAADLGADNVQITRHVTLPLLKPSLISASLFTFTLSFDEFLIAFFLSSGSGKATLPVEIWTMVREAIAPEVYAISVIVLVGSFIIASLAVKFEL
jgi:ABC-type spermidine/putrescine transport system permease subunit II